MKNVSVNRRVSWNETEHLNLVSFDYCIHAEKSVVSNIMSKLCVLDNKMEASQ
jgi:hypothetical protein